MEGPRVDDGSKHESVDRTNTKTTVQEIGSATWSTSEKCYIERTSATIRVFVSAARSRNKFFSD